MKKVIKSAGGIEGNSAPHAFHLWATHYQKCKKDFQKPTKFSPVPYFLVCRVIELELKARLLKDMELNREKYKTLLDQVKKQYGHDLAKAYNDLKLSEKILTEAEEKELRKASIIYKGKGFEYFISEDALTGYKRFPDLTLLDSIERKMVESFRAP